MNNVNIDMECIDQRMDFDVVAAIASKDGALIRVHVAARAGHTCAGLHKFSAMFFNIQKHTLAELQQQEESERAAMNAGPAKELHFDSDGYLHGTAGWQRALKDPENWEALWGGDFWVKHEIWTTWEDVDESARFQRVNDMPITHEELNA